MTRILSRLRDRDLIEIVGLLTKNLRHLIAMRTPAARAARAADLAFDRRWGTETSRGVSLHDLDIARSRMAQCRRYDPSSEAMLRDPVAALGIDPAEFTFVDYGAGKGRVLMLAMQMGFARITGVELSARLCEAARANIDTFAAQNRDLPRARVVGADATVFLPDGDDILAYFYNPFDASIMHIVRHRLESALRDSTRRVVVIYANPEHGQVFADAPGWVAGPVAPGVATFTAHTDSFRRRALAA